MNDDAKSQLRYSMKRWKGHIQPWVCLSVAALFAFVGAHPCARRALGLDAAPRPALGPFCLLAGAPSIASSGVWRLEEPEDVLPFDLLLAGYPESARGDHRVVARVTCTAYTSCICETDSTPDVTASNKLLRPGYIALSRDLLAEYTPGAPFRFGDRIELIGIGVFQVEDTMAARWRRRADIWLPSVDDAYRWGRRSVLIARLADHHDDIALLGSIERGGT